MDPLKLKQGLRLRPIINHSVSMPGATFSKLAFLNTELLRFEAYGAWERAHSSRFASCMFTFPKPDVDQWWLIIDLRQLYTYSSSFTMA
jgi:hypothetical protein